MDLEFLSCRRSIHSIPLSQAWLILYSRHACGKDFICVWFFFYNGQAEFNKISLRLKWTNLRNNHCSLSSIHHAQDNISSYRNDPFAYWLNSNLKQYTVDALTFRSQAGPFSMAESCKIFCVNSSGHLPHPHPPFPCSQADDIQLLRALKLSKWESVKILSPKVWGGCGGKNKKELLLAQQLQ